MLTGYTPSAATILRSLPRQYEAWTLSVACGRCRVPGAFDGYLNGELVTSGMSLGEAKERMQEIVRQRSANLAA